MKIVTCFLLYHVNAEISVLESIFPINEHNHIVSPIHGNGIASFNNMSQCLQLAKYVKGVSYFNQDLNSTNVYGLNMNINGLVTCIVSKDRWPVLRSNPIFVSPNSLSVLTPLGASLFNIGTYENLELSFEYELDDMPRGFYKFPPSTLSVKRIIEQNIVVLFSGSNFRLLQCIEMCDNMTECHHIQMFKSNVIDDTVVHCKLFKTENIVYETTTEKKFIHIKRKFDYNVIEYNNHNTKDNYYSDLRTITMIIAITILTLMTSLLLWELIERRIMI
jgi:hypothetical protein